MIRTNKQEDIKKKSIYDMLLESEIDNMFIFGNCYFLYGKSYKIINPIEAERIDNRVVIIVRSDNLIEILYRGYNEHSIWFPKYFNNLKKALNWIKNNIK